MVLNKRIRLYIGPTIGQEGKKNMTLLNNIKTELKTRKDRSAWDKGVTLYALELVESLEELESYNGEEFQRITEKDMLNGADNWGAYSWGGCSLICNSDIAKRLCNPSELKKTRNGERRPNSREEWLDTQARALYQAYRRIKTISMLDIH